MLFFLFLTEGDSNMDEFKSNSHRAREEEVTDKKKVEKVIKGHVKTKKKSSGRKLAEVFIPEDVDSVKSHILFDVVVPALKDTFYDAVTSGLSMLLGGEGRSSARRGPGTNSRESYSSYYKQNNRNSSTRTGTPANSSRYKYDDIVLESRGEAEEVLDVMIGLAEEYGMVSLADLYDAVGMSSNYTDNKYGWFDLHTASVVGNRSSGYVIKLPRISLLD